MRLCQYQNILGTPRKGFHALRMPIVDLALMDLLGMMVIAYFTHRLYPLQVSESSPQLVSYLLHFIGWWVLATGLHLLFCVKTPITQLFR